MNIFTKVPGLAQQTRYVKPLRPTAPTHGQGQRWGGGSSLEPPTKVPPPHKKKSSPGGWETGVCSLSPSRSLVVPAGTLAVANLLTDGCLCASSKLGSVLQRAFYGSSGRVSRSHPQASLLRGDASAEWEMKVWAFWKLNQRLLSTHTGHACFMVVRNFNCSFFCLMSGCLTGNRKIDPNVC